MSRVRTPTHLLAIRGSFAKNPQRALARSGEPVPTTPIRPAPKSLNPAQRACYRELVAQAHDGVLCSADGFICELGAVLLCELRTDPAGMSAAKLARLQSVLASLGCTPADRSRVTATPTARPTASGQKTGFDY